MELSFKDVGVFFAESVITVEASLIEGIQNHAAGSGNIAPIIDGCPLDFGTNHIRGLTTLIEPLFHTVPIFIALQHRQIAGTLRSSVHFQGNFYQIPSMECGEVVGQLLRVSVFLEERGDRIRTLTNMIATPPTTGGAFDGGYVLLADSDTVQHRDRIALLELLDIGKRSQTGEREEQTVALLAPELESLNIPLLRVKVSASRSAVLILAPQQVILLCELQTEFAIGREVHAQLIRVGAEIHNHRITETFATEQPVGIGMLPQIVNPGNIGTVHYIHSLLIYFVTNQEYMDFSL